MRTCHRPPMFKVLPKVDRFGTAIIGPRSQELVSVFASGGQGVGMRGQGRPPPKVEKFLLSGVDLSVPHARVSAKIGICDF